MKVSFYATLRDITGQKTIEFDVPEKATIQQLLDAVIQRYPELQDKLLMEDGSLRGYVHIFVNGRDARFLEEKLDTVTQPEDAINIFPAVGGG